MTEQNKDGAKCECDDAMSLKDVQLVFPFSFCIMLSYRFNDRLCRIYLFFSAALSLC